MDKIPLDFPLAARRVLGALAGFDPPWSLSGRAALGCWLSGVPRPIGQLDFVWHGLDRLGALHGQIVRTLVGAGLDVATLHGDSRRVWLGAGYGKSACLLSLTAEPGLPLAPPRETRLAGVAVTVDALREVIAATLCSLYERPGLQDLENTGLLLRNGFSLDQGLEDACDRIADLVPLDFALRLACFAVEGPDLSEIALERFRRYQERVVVKILAWAADATIPARPSCRSPRAAH
ncbi:MAG TPA: hypothetical protein VGS07_14295 [Thermoanaerobaculia bacterium]|jgi:hypothetical protein|nr:hypothetical protein [Thermoanaerobaculia bacterium]